MFLPGLLISILQIGVTAEAGVGEALTLAAKHALVSLAIGWAYAGVSVGSSAAVKKARWALLIALLLFTGPEALAELAWGEDAYPFSPANALKEFMELLLGGSEHIAEGLFGLGILIFYGCIGMYVITQRVRKEMIP
jgi:hypothetical protein